VLNHIERRVVLEQPAGKHLVPGQPLGCASTFFYVELDERTGLGRIFPRWGVLTGRDTNNDVADALRFATLELQVLDDVVALVEQADRCHPVLDRSADVTVLRDTLDRRARLSNLRG